MSLKFLTPSLCCKIVQALCGVLLTSDVLHKKASREFLNTFGFGAWFAPLVGLWEAAVAALLWYKAVGLQMAAVVLGGAVYAHVCCEKSLGGAVPTIGFIYLTVIALADASGGATADAAAKQAAMAAVGALVGVGVSALSPGKPKST